MKTLSEDLIVSSRSSLAGLVKKRCGGGHTVDQSSPLRCRGSYSLRLWYTRERTRREHGSWE
jgi:hypothetical protein